jgi:hypothetical protein
MSVATQTDLAESSSNKSGVISITSTPAQGDIFKMAPLATTAASSLLRDAVSSKAPHDSPSRVADDTVLPSTRGRRRLCAPPVHRSVSCPPALPPPPPSAASRFTLVHTALGHKFVENLTPAPLPHAPASLVATTTPASSPTRNPWRTPGPLHIHTDDTLSVQRISASRGLGVVAARDIDPGEDILFEAVLLFAAHDTARDGHQELLAAAEALGPEKHWVLRSLAASDRWEELDYVLARLRTNRCVSWAAGEREREAQSLSPSVLTNTNNHPLFFLFLSPHSFLVRNGSALFPIASRFNHACHPLHNVAYRYDDAHGLIVLTTTRAVARGDELTITYSRIPMLLPSHWGFVCRCGGECAPYLREMLAYRAPGQWW